MTPQQTNTPLIWAQRGLLGIALALMVFHLVVYVIFALSLLSFPFDYDQGEGFELNDTVLLSQGQTPYRSNEVFPYYASNYPPLFHLVLVPFAALFGPAYWYGRLAGFAATLITALVIAYAVQRGSGHRWAAVLAGLAYLASNYIYHVGPLFRQHISMVMLETVAVVCVAVADEMAGPRRRRLTVIALALLLAAGFTKQLAIATVAAVFVYFALRGVRRAITLAIPFAAVAGSIFLLINLSTQGQWWINIITANVNQFIMGQYTGLLRQFVGLHGALLILAGAFLLYELYLDRLSAYSVWFVASLIGTTLAGKWGAGDSYFATTIAATCLLAGLFTGRCLKRGWRLPPRFSVQFARLMGRLRLNMWISRLAQSLTPALGVLACALFVLYGLAVIKMPIEGPVFGTLADVLNLQSNTKFSYFYDSAGWTMGYATIGHVPSDQDTANGWKIVEAVRDDPRPILSEEAAFSFHTGKPVVTNPTQLLNLYLNNQLDTSALVKQIENQEFGAVIFRARFYPQPVLDAIDRAYVIEQVIPMNGYDYTILKPNPAWPKQS